MSATRHKPILVTGSHRSGSTWVGKMIACHPRVVYLSEPLHRERPHCPSKHWFHHVTAADEAQFLAYLRQPLAFRQPWWEDVERNRRAGVGVAGTVLLRLECLRRRWRGYRMLLKDPMALFSAEWLAKHFAADVLVLIRHPAAFVSSLKRLDWHFGLDEFLRQPALLDGYLQPFVREIRRHAANPPDLIDQAILMWRIFHHVIRQYQQTHPEWIFERHEDLALQPVEGFRAIYDRLGLTWGEKVRRTIEEHSSSENPSEAAEKVVHQLKRDSKASIWNWMHRLSPDEVLRVRRGTEDVAGYFYGEADWQLPLAA
jgi:hypothetical protein